MQLRKFFTRSDAKAFAIGLLVAIPVELYALRAMDKFPADIEPLIKPGGIEMLVGVGSVIIHSPVIWVIVAFDPPLSDGMIRTILFFAGYTDLVLLFAAALSLHRVVVRRKVRFEALREGRNGDLRDVS